MLAGINSRLQLYGWGQGSDGSMELSAEAGYSGFVLCLYVAVRGDFITVGEHMLDMRCPAHTASLGRLSTTEYSAPLTSATQHHSL